MENFKKANMHQERNEPPDEDSPILLNKTRSFFLNYEHKCNYNDIICENLKWIEERDCKIFILTIVFLYFIFLLIFCKREYKVTYKNKYFIFL